jgi:hypothetical protein
MSGEQVVSDAGGLTQWILRMAPPSPTQRPDADHQVQTTVQHSFAQGRGTYGTRRIKDV